MSRFTISDVTPWAQEHTGQPALNFQMNYQNGAALLEEIKPAAKGGVIQERSPNVQWFETSTYIINEINRIASGVTAGYLGFTLPEGKGTLASAHSATDDYSILRQDMHINDSYGAGISKRATELLDETGRKELAALIEEAVANHYGLELGQDVNLLAQQARTRQAARGGQEQQ